MIVLPDGGKDKQFRIRKAWLGVALGVWFMLVSGLSWGYLQSQQQVFGADRVVNDERVNVSHLIPTEIVVPSVGVANEIVAGSVTGDGVWEVSETEANYLIGSGVVGEKGNMVIYAHKRPELFLDLLNVSLGDEIEVRSRDQVAVYEVMETKVVQPDDVSVLEDTRWPELTVFTCKGWFDEERFVVKARLVKKYPTGFGSFLVDHVEEN